MIQQSSKIHSEKKQRPIPELQGPRSTIKIVTISVLVVLLVSVIMTILFIKDLSIEVAVITAVVLGLPGLMLAYFQWMFPRSSDDEANSAPSVPAQTVSQDAHASKTATAPSKEPTAQEMQDSALITGRVSANAVFFFNIVSLPSAQEFFGREMDRETLLNRTASRQATSLVGPRRIGKTWLMQYLMLTAPRRLGSRYRIGYLDATAPGCVTVAGFVATALKKLNVASPLSGEPNLLTLEQAVEDLRKKGYSPVLCIDEFERLSNSEVFDYPFFSGLRAMAHAGLGLVVASKSPLIEIVDDAIGTSPFFNIFEQLTLEPFHRQEAETFIQIKARQAGFTAREEAAMLRYGQIQEEQWPPLRLQLVGKLLLESIRAQQYQPDDERYWQKFQQRLEDKHQGAVR